MPDEKSFNLPQEEEKILEFWKNNKIFEKSLEKTKRGKPFTFYDGPPFATGLPHYGHILASTIKDVIPRYQTMRGRFVRRRWGWDCHGLPIEEIVERQVGISGKKQIEETIGIAKFNEICRATVLKYVSEWRKMVGRIARWVEFDDSYKTMDRDYMESVWWGFGEAYKKGLVYEGRKVLLYCPRCETPVSSFEVAMDNSYKDVTEESVIVKFKVIIEGQTKRLNLPSNTFLLAWTTTPWTLPGNVALAVNPEIQYGVYERGKENFILAVDRAKEYGFENPRVMLPGSQLRGVKYAPLYKVTAMKGDKSYKIYGADFVAAEDGTGIVHTAVVYGEDDYNLGLANGLPVVPLLDEKGKFNEKAPEFLRGMYFKKADKFILDDLEKRKILFKKEKYIHPYPHCWRCSNPLFYNAIPAFFINIQKIKKSLLRSNNEEVNWFPGHLKHGRYEKSVEQAPDWNISRNRYWGNPIPIWKCKKCLASPDLAKRDSAYQVISSIDELKKNAVKRNEFFFLRHGQADSNVKRIIGSHKDTKKYTSHLTVKGKADVKKTAEVIAKKKIDIIISSPLARTSETAKIVQSVTKAKIIYNKELVDINPGIFMFKPESQYEDYFKNDTEKFDTSTPNGENWNGVKQRMASTFSEINKKFNNKKILIVSHGDPLWLLKGALEGLSNEKILKADYPENGKLYEIDTRPLPLDDTGNVDLHRPYIDSIMLRCTKCKGESTRTPEIFDSWTEAGSMPFAEYHYPFEQKKIFESRFPAQFVAEYIAQTRAWFYVMHVIGIICFGKAPFENVVTTGTILAEDGSKMSKSKNNFPDPWEVINKYGVDSLRFYLMNSVVMQGDNLNFSVRDLESVYRKTNLILWNVNNYFKTYISVESWNKRPASDPRKAILDKWVIGRTNELVAGVTGYLDAYDTVKATRVIQEYIDDLSTWYVRRSRGRNDKAFFETLRDSLSVTCRVIAPFMPYLAEMIYLGLERKKGDPESVHLTDWPKADKKLIDKKLFESMAETRRIASLGLAKRAEAGIKVRQPLASLKIKIKNPKLSDKKFLDILKDEVNVKEIKFNPKISNEVELDTEITSELREEGILRGLKRAIQELRQEAGLKPGQDIELMLELPEELKATVSRNEKFLKSEVSAKVINYEPDRAASGSVSGRVLVPKGSAPPIHSTISRHSSSPQSGEVFRRGWNKKSEKFGAESETKIDGIPVWIGIKKLK